MAQDPQSKQLILTNLYCPPWIGDVVLAIGVAFFIFLVASALWISRNKSETHKNRAILLGAIFALAPPIYFFVEIFIFREWGVHEQWDQFKYIQETAAKFWAAGLVVLYAVYSRNFPK